MAKSKKLALVICYFGPLPAYADLFFRSVKANPTIDFILATDQLVKNPPANLQVKYLTLADLREKFQKKLGFAIRLHAPYKICDYRPAFGWLLSDWLKDYRYWGHCDLDQVMGDLEKFCQKNCWKVRQGLPARASDGLSQYLDQQPPLRGQGRAELPASFPDGPALRL